MAAEQQKKENLRREHEQMQKAGKAKKQQERHTLDKDADDGAQITAQNAMSLPEDFDAIMCVVGYVRRASVSCPKNVDLVLECLKASLRTGKH